jgi:hypothetical protein
MFKANSAISIRLSRWLILLLFSTLLISAPVVGGIGIPQAYAGASPAEDLSTIATYLRNYQGSDLRNPNFYPYTLDGNAKTILDGGGDMYDNGNNTAPWLISNTRYSNLNNINENNALAYDITVPTTTDGDFRYVSLGYGISPDRRPLTMLGTRTTAGNPIGFQKYGNAGTDGGGAMLSSRFINGEVLNGFTVYAFYRLNYNGGDPSICDLYMLIGQTPWNSSFGTIEQYADPSSNGGNGAHFYSTGAGTRNLLAITTLLSKDGGTAVTEAEMRTIVRNYTLRIREAVGPGYEVVSALGNTIATNASVPLVDTITTSGFTTTPTLTMSAPAAPGISFSGGLMTVNVVTPGTYSQTFTATQGANTASLVVTILVNAPPSASLSSSNITTTIGRIAAETLTVTGGTTLASGGTANLSFTRQSSNSQTGITLDTSTASSGRAVLRVAATGVAVGTYFETVTARDNRGATTVSVFTVIVNAAPTLSGARTVANGTLSTTLGVASSETVTVVGGTGNKTFTLTQGSVSSAGITLDTTTANSGFVVLRVASNVAANTYLETITATDTRGSAVTYFFRVTVNPVITIGSATTSSFATPSGTAATNTLTVSGGTTPRTMTLISTPTNAGITLTTGASGQAVLNISSTVAAATYLETITVTDAVGATAVHVVTLTVSGPIRMDASNANVINTSFGRAASTVIRTVSGNTNKVFTKVTVSPASSAGITLDTTTAGSGFVTLNVSSSTAIGTYIESITVVDSSNSRAVATVTINVNPAPVLTFESSTAGSSFSSMSFNGTGAHVTLPANANWQLGSDYTIEWWQYQTGNNAWPRIFSFGSNGLAVSIESGNFYFWNNGANIMNASSVGNLLNQWVHFAIVSRNNSVIVYMNGVALRSALTLTTVGATQIPTSSQLCIALKCATGNVGEMFGGQITNFTIDKSARYSGTSTSIANFRPSGFVTVNNTTLVALTSVNSEARMTDSSSFARIVTNVNSPTGSPRHPSASAASVSVVTTQGLATRSAPFTASSGTGNKTFTLAPTISGITLDTSTANSAVIVLDPSLAATNTTTAATYNESVTATDSLNSSTAFNVVITVNPRIILTAATPSVTTSFGVAAVDTITATANTGTGAITFSLESNPFSSGITLVANGARSTVLTVARTVPQGIYYETITATDSLGSRTSIPITVTVNPGITLAGAGGVSTINTSVGRTASLQVNALNGASGRTFTRQAASVATSAGITLDTTNAASGFAVVRVAANVLANTYRETITVTDSAGGVARLLVTIIVNAAPTLTGPTTVAVTAGRAGSTTVFTTSGGTGNKTFSLSPVVTGITIETATATTAFVRLASTLTSVSSTQPRTISETVTATDETGATANLLLTVTVNPAVIETATASSITMTSGVVRTSTIFASQGTGNKTFTRASSTSSPGITMTTLVTNQALLTVAASVSPGQYFETITATDTLGAETSTVISILVNAPPTVTGPPSLVTTFGVGFTSPIYQATGGDGTYSFTLISNPVSAGITVTSPLNGVARINVGGSVAAGTYNETLTVTDSSGATGRYNFTIRVNAPVALSGTQTINTTYGEAFTTGFNSSGGTGPFTFAVSNICAVSRSTFTGNGLNGTINGRSYTVDQILGVGTCNWLSPLGVESASVLVVGGGGAGGTVSSGSSGGGGGGRVLESTINFIPSTSVAVAVGAGGIPTPIASVATVSSSGNGESSSVTPSGGSAISALGGGGGANSRVWTATQGVGSTTGWTGGGGSSHAATASSGSTGSGGAGLKGGNALGDCCVADPQAGGGGGGAGGAGANAVSGTAGSGGSGVQSSLSGSTITYGGGGGGGKRTASGSAGTATGGGGAGGRNAAGSAGSPNLGGGGGGSGENSSDPWANLGGAGGSGTVVLRYLTPTIEADNSRISYLVSSPGTSSTAGLLTLSVPESVSAGSYSHTVVVRDSLGAASSPVTINITVAKANPIVALSLPAGATSTSYGFGALLTAQATTAGTVNFRENGTTISGCGSKTTTSLVATCRWVPATTGVRTITSVFTPIDTNNFNTGVISTFLVTVTQAETLTVTARSETFAFTDTTTAVTRGFTLTGLAEIDSATAVTMTYVGTPNDTSAGLYSSTTAPRLAGDNYEIRPTSLVFSVGSSSNYRAITYVIGTLTITRASQVANFNYRNSNVLTYAPNGIETLTATSRGEALRTFAGSTPDKCSIESTTGTLSIIEAGSCSVTMEISQGFNFLSTAVTKSVTIAKASRTISLASSAATIKYGDTATVTTTIGAGALDGVVSYTASSPTSCTFDEVSGEITAISGTGTCGLTARISEGVNYLGETSTALSITAAKADGLIVTAETMTAAAYTGSTIVISPTFTVFGLKFTDTAGTSLTFTYTNLNYTAYSSTTPPTQGGLYRITPSGLSLTVGSLLNYNSPIYRSSDWEIEQIDQPQLVLPDVTGDFTFPVRLVAIGGAPTTPAVTFEAVAGTATNCRVVFGPIAGSGGVSVWSLQADSAGTCSAIATKPADRNYRVVTSETSTVKVLQFIRFVYVPEVISNPSTGVAIIPTVPLTKGPDVCTSGCVPTITLVSPFTGYVGDIIVLTGTNFTGTTKVIFNVFTEASNFTVDSDTQITVQIPTGLPAGETGIEVVAAGGTSSRNFDLEIL